MYLFIHYDYDYDFQMDFVGCLGGRDGSARVVVHDAGNDDPKLGALVAAPDEVVAGEIDEELVLAGGDGERRLHGRFCDALVGGRGRGLCLHGFVDCEDEENEHERGE